jgi:hypothetical protein
MNDDPDALPVSSLAGLDAEDRELARDFMRIVCRDGGFDLEVAVVWWHGQVPDAHWTRTRRWKREPDTDRIERAVRRALSARKYFRRCDVCGRRCNVGHMMYLVVLLGPDDACREQCQSCAEARGVVF